MPGTLYAKAIIEKVKCRSDIFIASAATLLLYRISLVPFDNSVFHYTVQASCLLAILLICFAPRDMLAAWIRTPAPEQSGNGRDSALYFCFGFCIIVGVLWLLEIKQPYYFAQFDNHFLAMPTIIQAMRGFFSEGIFPSWNGYVLLSGPTTSLGYYALTYPLMYGSYAIARFLFHDEFHLMDVLLWLEILGGYSFGFFVFRSLNIRAPLAAAAALSYVLLGYNLIAGRGLFHYLPTVIWLPALMLSVTTLKYKDFSLRWVILTALAIGIFFHAANLQLWFYSMAFWALGVLWVTLCRREYIRNQLVHIIMAGLVGIAICAPLLVVESIELSHSFRGQVDETVMPGLSNLLVPWPLIASPQIFGHTGNQGTGYFSGGIFIFAFFLCCAFQAAYLTKCRLQRASAINLIYSLFAILALVLAMGPEAKLWSILLPYPPFSYFRIPLKFLPFLVFFMTISGALFIENAMRKIRFGKIMAACIACAAASLAAYNAAHCEDAVNFLADRPYPSLPDTYTSFQATGYATHGRIAAYTNDISPIPRYTLALGKNYATYYQIPAAFGLNGDTPDMTLPENIRAASLFGSDRAKFFHEFAVDWATVSKFPGDPRPLNDADIARIHAGAPRVLDLGVADAFYIHTADTKPMAYVQSSPQTPLPYKIRTDGVDIDVHDSLQGGAQIVVANFLYRHWFNAFTDTGEALRIIPDAMGRIAVFMPAAAKTLSIRYSPPWHYGFYGGFMLVGIAALLKRFCAPKTKELQN